MLPLLLLLPFLLLVMDLTGDGSTSYRSGSDAAYAGYGSESGSSE
nr:hypothetical protein Q903MT_gene27 [Picea sitchensis]